MQTRIKVGERFFREDTLETNDISQFAKLVGDSNPVHHGTVAAKDAGFDDIIASGTHTSAILTALLAGHYSCRAPMLGLEFAVRFLRPIFAGRCCRYEWEVISVQTKSRLSGELVSLAGYVYQDGKAAISATASIAVMFDKAIPKETCR